jgi:hypothetical protein
VCIREYCCLPDHGQHRSIRQYLGVDGTALEQVRALTDWHIEWEDGTGSGPTHAATLMTSEIAGERHE